jgi:hypothetical protein
VHPAKTGRDSALRADQPPDCYGFSIPQISKHKKREDKPRVSQLILEELSLVPEINYRSMIPARRQGVEW